MDYQIFQKQKKGFTLIELLVVISIISLLSSVVLSALNSARQKAKIAETASDLRQIVNALLLYQSDHNGNYPCFDHNWDDGAEKAWSLPYLKWPKDPLGTPPNDWLHWENGYGPFTYSISLNNPGSANALALDKYMDDGNLNTGNIKQNPDGSRIEYAGMDQTVDPPVPLFCP